MKSPTELPDDVRDFLSRVIDEALERDRDHLAWLDKNPDEPDRDLQRAEN